MAVVLKVIDATAIVVASLLVDVAVVAIVAEEIDALDGSVLSHEHGCNKN